jgi:hypothetical protein
MGLFRLPIEVTCLGNLDAVYDYFHNDRGGYFEYKLWGYLCYLL